MKIKDIFESKEVTVIGKKISSFGKSPVIFTTDQSGKPMEADFFCDNEGLTTLVGCPSSVYSFECDNNDISSLEGSPKKVVGYYSLCNNKLTSLKDIHKHCPEVTGLMYFDNNPIKSHVLGVLLISGADGITLDNTKVAEILNKYLPNKRGRAAIYDCQDELINAGFEEYAQL